LKQRILVCTWSAPGLHQRASFPLAFVAQPDLSASCREVTVEISARPSEGGLHLLVDATGIKDVG
jgi:hypothetical protein